MLPHIAQYLNQLQSDSTATAATRGEALKLMKSVLSFDFIVAITVANLAIGTTRELCKTLQGENEI